jgi:16S rRNA G966 N2-methylase RsmD
MDIFTKEFEEYNLFTKSEYICNNNITFNEKLIIKDEPSENNYNYNFDAETFYSVHYSNLLIALLLNKYESLTNEMKIALFYYKEMYYNDKIAKLFNITIKNNMVYIDDIPQISLVLGNVNHDKRFTFYELFNNIKLLTSNYTRQTNNCSFQIFGPDEIKNKTLYLLSDFFEMVELFRKNMYDYNEGNNNICFVKPVTFGKKLEYNKIDTVSHSYTKLDINYIINKMEKPKDFRNILSKLEDIDLFEMRDLSSFTPNLCLYEPKKLVQYMALFYIMIRKLVKGGSIIIEISKLNNTPTIQFIYFISKFFKKIIFFHDITYAKPNIYKLVFIYFTGASKEDIHKYGNILRKYIKINNNLTGENINSKNINTKQCKKCKKCKKEEMTDKQIPVFIHNIFEFDGGISDEFIKWIKNINDIIKINIVKYIKLYDKLSNILLDENISIEKRKKFLLNIIKNNIDTSIKYCIKNNITYNEIVKEQEIEKDIAKYYFPQGDKTKIDFTKIQMSNESFYSVTHYKDADLICELIQKHITDNIKNLVITDGCANVGGNTISFLKHFKFCNAVEYLELHSKMLQNNIKLYGFTNYKIYNDDYTKISNKLKQDIIFLDPPWGGINYKYYDTINLYLSGKSLADIIENIISNAKLICVKAPFNYDVQTLYQKKFKEIHIYKLKKYQIIIIKN